MNTNNDNTDLLSILVNLRDKSNNAIIALNEAKEANINSSDATIKKQKADIKSSEAVNSAMDTVTNVSMLLKNKSSIVKPGLNTNKNDYPVLYKTRMMSTDKSTPDVDYMMPTKSTPDVDYMMPTKSTPDVDYNMTSKTTKSEVINMIPFNLSNMTADNTTTKTQFDINNKGIFSQLEITGVSINQNQNQYNYCSSLAVGIMRNNEWLIKQTVNIAQSKSNINFTIVSQNTIMLEETDKIVIELNSLENCKTDIIDSVVNLYYRPAEGFHNTRMKYKRNERKIFLLIFLFILIMIIILLNKCKK